MPALSQGDLILLFRLLTAQIFGGGHQTCFLLRKKKHKLNNGVFKAHPTVLLTGKQLSRLYRALHTRIWKVASSCNHEPIEELRQQMVRLQRQYMGNVLVRPHHHQGSLRSVDASQVEDVGAVLDGRSECLFVVDQPKAPFSRQQERRHRCEVQSMVRLLENGPQVEDRVNVLVRCADTPQRTRTLTRRNLHSAPTPVSALRP